MGSTLLVARSRHRASSRAARAGPATLKKQDRVAHRRHGLVAPVFLAVRVGKASSLLEPVNRLVVSAVGTDSELELPKGDDLGHSHRGQSSKSLVWGLMSKER